MIEFIVGVPVGLLVGWLFLPMPNWVKDLYLRIFPPATF